MTSNQVDRNQPSDSSATSSRVDRIQNDPAEFGQYGRRAFLSTAGSVAVAGLLAGCLGESSGAAGADAGSDGSEGTTGTNSGDGGNSIDAWLADTDNYDSVENMTGKRSVTVEVGAEGNKGAYAFEPAAIKVSPRTTVVWEWIDGYHNVVEKDEQFTSGEPELNATFEHTFETAGTALYSCEPHESMGMKGAVIVVNEGNTSGSNSSTVNE